MTLDEAIQHCEEKAREQEENSKSYILSFPNKQKRQSCLKCARIHRQLAAWLKELKEYRERWEDYLK